MGLTGQTPAWTHMIEDAEEAAKHGMIKEEKFWRCQGCGGGVQYGWKRHWLRCTQAIKKQ